MKILGYILIVIGALGLLGSLVHPDFSAEGIVVKVILVAMIFGGNRLVKKGKRTVV